MQRLVLSFGVTALMLSCTLQTRQPFTPGHREAIVDSVTAALDTYRRNVNDGNWDAVREVYANDSRFHVVEDGAVRYSDVDSVYVALDMLQTMFTRVRLMYNDLRVVPLAPGVANATIMYDQAFDDSTGTVFTLEGALTLTLVHLDSGWKVLVGHTSTPRERPPG